MLGGEEEDREGKAGEGRGQRTEREGTRREERGPPCVSLNFP